MSKALSRVALSAIVLVNCLCLYLVFVHGDGSAYGENGLMENLQVALLAGSAFAFFAPAIFQEKRHKLFLISCSVLCLSFFLRELDVEKLDINSFLILIGSGTGRNLLLGTAWLFILVSAVFDFSYYKKTARSYMLSKVGIALIAAGGLLVLGGLFDREVLTSNYGRFYEELLELNAYISIFLGALVCRSSLEGVACND